MEVMTKPKYTAKDCHEEMVRLLRLYFYSKATTEEKDKILECVKQNLESLAKIEEYKNFQAEEKRARKEAEKLGIRR